MKLKDYNKRRKLRFGGDPDPVPRYLKKSSFDEPIGYGSAYRHNKKLSISGPIVFEDSPEIKETIKKDSPGPISLNRPQDSFIPTWSFMEEPWSFMQEHGGVPSPDAAERELEAIKLEEYNQFIQNANNAGIGNPPAKWTFLGEHGGVPSPDKEPPSNNVINAEKKGGKGSSNNTKATNSSTDYKFLDDSKIKRQSVPDVKLSEPSKTVNASPVKVKNVPRPSSKFSSRPSSKSSSGIGIGEIALQFLPDLINFGTGLFGKDKTLPKTKVSKAAVANMPSRFNVNPQLEKNSASYRAILSDPNATMNQKLAALVSKHRADSEVLTNKENIERQMEANKAALEANLDSQQARYDEVFREDKMMSDANLGLTGNFARSSLANMSQKGLGLIAQRNQRRQDDIALAAILAGVDEATRNRILEAIKNAK